MAVLAVLRSQKEVSLPLILALMELQVQAIVPEVVGPLEMRVEKVSHLDRPLVEMVVIDPHEGKHGDYY
jgi:hypothetical protein